MLNSIVMTVTIVMNSHLFFGYSTSIILFLVLRPVKLLETILLQSL
jgi:hypothetical protein